MYATMKSMGPPELDVTGLRNALPASVAVRLTDTQLLRALREARVLLGDKIEASSLQGAAWMLAHDPDERREQVEHLLAMVALRREFLQQAEAQLLGAFAALPELDDTARDITVKENLDYLDRLEELVGLLTARVGGSTTATVRELSEAPPFIIELEDQTLRVTTFDDDLE
ncbi:hypothetical protein ACIGB8_27675 [Promicromonospora sukumoe]|uniref:hypothetical protein n=1 Tax=Promicromonospora sukumoe TaxID=88382 RepID=UPI0037C60B30